VEGDSVD